MIAEQNNKRGPFLRSFLSLGTSFFGTTCVSPIQPRIVMNNPIGGYDAAFKRVVEQKAQEEEFERLRPAERCPTQDHLFEEDEPRISLLNIRSDEEESQISPIQQEKNQQTLQICKKISDLDELDNGENRYTEKFSKVLPARQCHNLRIRASELGLGKVIGEGGFGKVYRGTWRGRTVAIKKINSGDMDENLLAEFSAEIEIMRLLRHPNICRLLGACFDPSNQSLVIEYLSQGSLWSVLRRQRDTITEEMRLGFIMDTVAGMSYLHGFHPPILHRDMKSPNLLVDANYNIKIADFGLSRVKARVATMTGNVGTVQWMAPEVLDNRRYTEKADVFSFGIILWEIYTAKCPYDGMNQVQVGVGVLNRNIRPSIPRNSPPFMVHLMKACWQRHPEARPSFPQIMSLLIEYKKLNKRMH